MWRTARSSDDASIAALGRALFSEDPTPEQVLEPPFERTLAVLRDAPWRGRALVLDADRAIAGYALLVSFWSNELGGEVCVIDELYVAPVARNRGWATRLIESLATGSDLWPGNAVALVLGVSATNVRARALYERLGFTGTGVSLSRRCGRGTPTGSR
jgi:ribosomal protein S18 acetylase RimI-like enzyme